MSTAGSLGVVEQLGQANVLLHPLRLKIIEELRQPDSASSLARRLKIPRQKLNYHIRELEREGFLEQVEERRKGNCVERIVRTKAQAYLIDPALLGALGIDPKDVQDRLSSAYLVAVAAKLIREVAVLRSRAEKAGKRLATLTLQTDVRFRSASARNAFAEEFAKSIGYLSAKYNDENAEGGRSFHFIVAGYPALAEEPQEQKIEERKP